ncbi:hypothetical protein [Streptomyces sp. SID13726]|uniref:hypothetical protein n=1 Tax=Streptomyces sp. SID13726 TaxID=2706058 RepID=UPI0013BCC273|nr:hypothetical protein [Streptomyces sp. SID13726]NEB03204.1 hypothetical protein [Streptomyces sp. SID13726]
MAHPSGKYADFEGLREQALALRRAGLSRRQIRDRLHVDNNDILNRLLEGEPPPEWTKRPNSKDDLRDKARELRLQGWTYDQIQVELGCSKSSISLWVRDLPKPERKRTSEEAAAIARRGWEATLRTREEARKQRKAEAGAEIGVMTDRELFLVGVGLYWAEGTKDKPHIRFHVMIHESADVAAAENYWADLVEADRHSFGKTTLKRHNPKTVRKNTGDSYQGCLAVTVRQSADLYRRIEGWWYGIVGAATASDRQNRA